MAVPGVSVPFWQGGLLLRLVAGVISAQPFADEIGGYTCRDRDQKRNQIFHVNTPFPASIGSGNEAIIAEPIVHYQKKRQTL